MPPRDITTVSTGECRDLYAVDVGRFGLSDVASVYLLHTPKPTIVETGAGANVDRIVDALSSVGIAVEDVANIVVTHTHLDNAGGAGFLASICPNADVYVHERGMDQLVDPSPLVAETRDLVGEDCWDRYFVEPVSIDADRLHPVTDRDVIDVGDRVLRVHLAPGHASEQIILHSPADDAVFAADTLGIYDPQADSIYALTPPPAFDAAGALADIELIRSLNPSTLLCSHFGPIPTADRLNRAAEAIIKWVRAVRIAREDADADGAVIARFVADPDAPAHWPEDMSKARTEMNVRGVMQYLDRQHGVLPPVLKQELTE